MSGQRLRMAGSHRSKSSRSIIVCIGRKGESEIRLLNLDLVHLCRRPARLREVVELVPCARNKWGNWWEFLFYVAEGTVEDHPGLPVAEMCSHYYSAYP
jgi:hypothetical protein